MPYIPKNQLREIMLELAKVSQVAKMGNASFAKPGEMFPNKEYSDSIKESTRNWREAWIRQPIDDILKDLSRYTTEKG